MMVLFEVAVIVAVAVRVSVFLQLAMLVLVLRVPNRHPAFAIFRWLLARLVPVTLEF